MEIVKKKQVDSTSSMPTGLTVAPDTRMRQAQAEAAVRYQMAFMLKRDWTDVEAKLLAACDNPQFAQEAVWTRVIDGETKRDLSVKFAERAQQLMRNIEVATIPYLMDDIATHHRLSVTDTESNTTISEIFMVRHTVERRGVRAGDTVLSEYTAGDGTKVFVVPATDEQIDAKKRSIGARVKRALLLSMMPAEVRASCLKRCVEIMEKDDAVDPAAALKQVVQSFLSAGVETSDLKEYLGHPVQGSTLQELQELRTLLVALRAGDTTWAAALDARSPKKTPGKDAFVQQKQQQRAAKPSTGAPRGARAAASTAPAEPTEKPKRGRKAATAAGAAASAEAGAPTEPAKDAPVESPPPDNTEERPPRRNMLSDDDDDA